MEKACFETGRHAFSIKVITGRWNILYRPYHWRKKIHREIEDKMKQKKITTYEEAVAYLLSIPKFAKKTTKENLLHLLNELGNPHLEKKAIHVAGTNGKGSTCAYMNSILMAKGIHVGMFTSPHLVSLEERFQIDGVPVQKEEFLQCFFEFYNAMEKLMEQGCPHVSFFEGVFVIATLIFKRHKEIDYVIYETGLGGRLDATNVLQPELVVITSIGYDHMQYLGNTIEEIAAEKAGIIKEHTPVIYLESFDSSPVIVRKAVEHHAKHLALSKESIKIHKKNQKAIDFCLENRYIRYDSLTIDTCAEYQVENAGLAILALTELCPDLTKEEVEQGLKQMKWPCRMEEVMEDVYIDGAHNEPAIERFLETVKSNGKEAGLLFSVVADKNYETMIKQLTEQSLFSYVIVTSIQGERGEDASFLAKQFLGMGQEEVEVISESEAAFSKAIAWKQEKENRILYCAGSLYLAGELKKRIREEKE